MSEGKRRWILSGGIGSGKSTVRLLLEEQGATTVDADSIGHEVIRSNGPAFAEVAARWPEVIGGGEVGRAALAAIVFADPSEMASLESITHPHIFDTIQARVQGIPGSVIVEIPIIHHRLGEAWRRMVVDCDDDSRLERAVAGGLTREDVRARMAAQPTRCEWLASADLVVPNHGSVDELKSTVAQLRLLI